MCAKLSSKKFLFLASGIGIMSAVCMVLWIYLDKGKASFQKHADIRVPVTIVDAWGNESRAGQLQTREWNSCDEWLFSQWLETGIIRLNASQEWRIEMYSLSYFYDAHFKVLREFSPYYVQSLIVTVPESIETGKEPTNEVLKEASSLIGLRELRIKGLNSLYDYDDVTKIDDEGLKYLSKLLYLEELELTGQGITDEGLDSLENLVLLRSLILVNTSVTDNRIELLQEKLPYVKVTKYK